MEQFTPGSQIDYILVRGRQKRNITNRRVIPNINKDTDDEHVVFAEQTLHSIRSTEQTLTRHCQKALLKFAEGKKTLKRHDKSGVISRKAFKRHTIKI